jgi:hypothetical protein
MSDDDTTYMRHLENMGADLDATGDKVDNFSESLYAWHPILKNPQHFDTVFGYFNATDSFMLGAGMRGATWHLPAAALRACRANVPAPLGAWTLSLGQDDDGQRYLVADVVFYEPQPGTPTKIRFARALTNNWEMLGDDALDMSEVEDWPAWHEQPSTN